MRLVRIIAAAAFFPLASCVPWPHLETEVPAISGCVNGADGQPRAGLLVEVSTEGHTSWAGHTDEKGTFYFPGSRRFRVFRAIVPRDRFIRISVRVLEDERLLLTKEIGVTGEPRSIDGQGGHGGFGAAACDVVAS